MSEPSSEAIADRVLHHPFFVGLDPTLVHAMISKAEERTYDVGEMLVREGRPAEEFFLVVDGKVALEVGSADRGAITVETIGRGEILGWSWLVAPYRWRFDARATKPTQVVAINAAAARYALAAHPALAYQFLLKFLPVIAERLENTRV
ncbi:MAG TPA: cyclic nucleotide-binding domain-containing protein, partial [Thermoplasmata archaeon]|nr:cyclic nucleotide-binding domain-containing protein [Thermoplasmata archaeon]